MMVSQSQSAVYLRRLRARQNGLGLCIDRNCDKPPEPGRKRCAEHLAEQRQLQAEYRQRKHSKGVCQRGGCWEPTGFHSYCAEHRPNQAAAARRSNARKRDSA